MQEGTMKDSDLIEAENISKRLADIVRHIKWNEGIISNMEDHAYAFSVRTREYEYQVHKASGIRSVLAKVLIAEHESNLVKLRKELKTIMDK